MVKKSEKLTDFGGSGSGSKNTDPDPDPTKKPGSDRIRIRIRIRIRNTAVQWILLLRLSSLFCIFRYLLCTWIYVEKTGMKINTFRHYSKEKSGKDHEEFYLNQKFKSTDEALKLFKDDPLLTKPGILLRFH